MEEEGVRNFKELRAKFQKFDAPPLPGPIKFPAGVSQKGDQGCTQSTQILVSGKYFSSSHNRPLSYCSDGESQPIKTQKMNFTQRNEIQSSRSPTPPPEKSAVYPARNSQIASVLLDVNRSRTEISNEEKVMAANSFRYKLWNWEKVSSQKNDMSPALPLANYANKTIHLKGQKTMELTQEKPKKNLETTEIQTLLPQKHLMDKRKSPVAFEDSPSPLSQHGRKSPGQERSLGSSPCHAVYDCEIAGPTAEQQHPLLPKTKPLPSIETLGSPPPKPSKPPVVNLQAFHRQPAAITKTPKEVSVKMGHLPLDSAELEELHNYEATISYLRHSDNSINLCAAEEIADVTYEVEIEEVQKPWKSFLHQDLRHKDEDTRKEKEPCDPEPHKPENDSHPNPPLKAGANERAPGKIQMTRVHEDRRSVRPGNQEAVTGITQTKVFPEDVKLARHSQDKGGYVEALEVTKETPNPGTIMSNSFSEETYDDVECSREDMRKWDFSGSFPSDSEEISEEMYEDIYKTKNNDQKVDSDGKAALKRLQQFFRREKGAFKTKKPKPKDNGSNKFSISLPDLGFRSQEAIIYDDVDKSEKEPKDEDKLKTWKAKFLPPKGKKEKKDDDRSESFSPRNFFRTKKQNLEKNDLGREEKLFRERFQYDKEITVINRAVACSSNSRTGILDLPITAGEELEVIDTTEQNLVLCRNSKGKYGYVLIEHLNFKHQGWSH